jgi:hypothetical protein
MKKYCVFVLLALISYSLSFAGPEVSHLPSKAAVIPEYVAPQSGAIPLVSVASNDSRVTPAFAELGEMHEVGGVIFSGAWYVPSQAAGEEFCRGLGGGSYLPSKEELGLLDGGLGYPDSYDPNQISDQAGRIFWSSSVYPDYPGVSYGLIGDEGIISRVAQNFPGGSVRCCVRAD